MMAGAWSRGDFAAGAAAWVLAESAGAAAESPFAAAPPAAPESPPPQAVAKANAHSTAMRWSCWIFIADLIVVCGVVGLAGAALPRRGGKDRAAHRRAVRQHAWERMAPRGDAGRCGSYADDAPRSVRLPSRKRARP